MKESEDEIAELENERKNIVKHSILGSRREILNPEQATISREDFSGNLAPELDSQSQLEPHRNLREEEREASGRDARALPSKVLQRESNESVFQNRAHSQHDNGDMIDVVTQPSSNIVPANLLQEEEQYDEKWAEEQVIF